MNAALQLRHERNVHVDVLTASGALLWRYVYHPRTPASEAPRPYAHPVQTLAGDVLTNFRPHDHPWHHALSFTITRVDGLNFWGGPTYLPADGYQWRNDQGTQVHRTWSALEPGRLEHALDWCHPASGRILLHERRTLCTRLAEAGWSLRWTSELMNVAGRELAFGNYEASGGLRGSHYTGLQFRGARELLDDHGDAAIGITADGAGEGEAQVHGALSPAMEWHCRHDGSLRRTRIRFESDGDTKWFVRRKNPLAAFCFHRGEVLSVPAGATVRFDHTLSFASQP